MIPTLFQELQKLAAKFEPLSKLDAAVKKNCKACTDETYKPVPQGNAKVATDASFQPVAQKPDVSEDEARGALDRLKRLEATKPTASELGRGALVGASISPLATMTARGVMGDPILGDPAKKFNETMYKSKNKLVRTVLDDLPESKNRYVRAVASAAPLAMKGFHGLRNMAASSATGAFFGGAMPAMRSELDRGAERKKLRAYLGQQQKAEPGYLKQLYENTVGKSNA